MYQYLYDIGKCINTFNTQQYYLRKADGILKQQTQNVCVYKCEHTFLQTLRMMGVRQNK